MVDTLETEYTVTGNSNSSTKCNNTKYEYKFAITHRCRKVFTSGGGGILVKRAEDTSRVVGTLC